MENPLLFFKNIKNNNVHYQLSPDELEDKTLELGMGQLTNSGALAVNTGEFTEDPQKTATLSKIILPKKKFGGGYQYPF